MQYRRVREMLEGKRASPCYDGAEKNVRVRTKTGGETMAMRRDRVCNVRTNDGEKDKSPRASAGF
jgi:hypothetical protein